MKTFARARRSLVALAVVGAAFMAVSAAPAMGAVHWSDTTHGIKLTGSLTMSTAGNPNVNCTFPSTQVSLMETNSALIAGSGGGYLVLKCPGEMELYVYMTAKSTTSVEFHGNGTSLKWPWSEARYSPAQAFADFTNGSGLTMSTLTFSNDTIGWLNCSCGQAVIANGTVNVTTSSGGLLTLLP